MTEAKEKVYVASPDFILREIGGEAVLVHTGNDEEYENSVINLNETYAFLLKQFETPSTFSECLKKAKAEYEDPEGRLEEEAKSAVAELIVRGILVPKE